MVYLLASVKQINIIDYKVTSVWSVIYGKPELVAGSEKFFTSKVASITYEVSSNGGDTYTNEGDFASLTAWFNTTPTTTSITFVRSIFVFQSGVIGVYC